MRNSILFGDRRGAVVAPPENPEEPPYNPPSSGLTQSNMPTYDQAWALNELPAMIYSANPTITAVVAPVTDTRLALSGFATKGLVDSGGGFRRPSFLADKSPKGSTDPDFAPMWGLLVRTNAQSLEFRMRQHPSHDGKSNISTRMAVRVKVNGQYTSLDPTYLGPGNTGYQGITPSFISAGTEFSLRLNFQGPAASGSTRLIELITQGEIASVAVPSGSVITAATAPQRTAICLSDSLQGAEAHGTGRFVNAGSPTGMQYGTYSHVSSMFSYAAHGTGYDNVVNGGVGSSGYMISGDTLSYSAEARISEDIVKMAPDFIFIGTPFNDIASKKTPAEIGTATNALLATLKSRLPKAILFVLGAPTPPILAAIANGTAIVTQTNAAQKSACQSQGAWFLDPQAGDLYTPAGVRVLDLPNMIDGNEQYISSDATHPTQAGARFFGRDYIARAMRLAHPIGSSTETPTLTAPATPAFSVPSTTTAGTDLAWGAAARATSYSVVRDNAVIASGLTTLTFRDTAVKSTSSGTFRYVIRAINAAGTTASVERAVTVGTTTPPPSGDGNRPTLVSSFGANGTHYPTDLVFPYQSNHIAKSYTASSQSTAWSGLQAVLETFTPAQVDTNLCVIYVNGDFPGYGIGSSDADAFVGLKPKNYTGTGRVLIVPEERGSARIVGAAANLVGARNVALFGFDTLDGATGFKLERPRFVDMGWMYVNALNIGGDGYDVNHYEIVAGYNRQPQDTAGWRPRAIDGPPGSDQVNRTVRRIGRFGCSYGPSFKPAQGDGSTAHCDTLQTERSDEKRTRDTAYGPKDSYATPDDEFKYFGDFVHEDCADFASSNALYLVNVSENVTFRHVLGLGDFVGWLTYPTQTGDYNHVRDRGAPNGFSGDAKNARAFDSIFAGSFGSTKWAEVRNSVVSYKLQSTQQPDNAAANGAFGVNAAILTWTEADVLKLLPRGMRQQDTALHDAIWQY